MPASRQSSTHRIPRARAASAVDAESLPRFCDYSCPHAGFAPADAVGACRRDQAVSCGLLHRLIPKNAPCALRKVQPRRRA